MKRFILVVLITALLLGGIISFVFFSNQNMSITYIKFNINPIFILGVNNEDVVKTYNPLNEDAKVLNIGMLNNKSLEEASKIIISVLSKNNFIKDKKIDITVITKNKDKINYYYQKINNEILKKDKDFVLTNKKSSHDELLTYSNEVVYDIDNVLDKNALKEIGNLINNEIVENINQKLANILNDKMTLTEKKKLINQKNGEGYFNDYLFPLNGIGNYQVAFNDNSNYKIVFNDDLTYKVIINFDLEYHKKDKVENKEMYTIENYIYTYNDGVISNLQNNFYRY